MGQVQKGERSTWEIEGFPGGCGLENWEFSRSGKGWGEEKSWERERKKWESFLRFGLWQKKPHSWIIIICSLNWRLKARSESLGRLWNQYIRLQWRSLSLPPIIPFSPCPKPPSRTQQAMVILLVLGLVDVMDWFRGFVQWRPEADLRWLSLHQWKID